MFIIISRDILILGILLRLKEELAWCSGSVIDCHTTAQGSSPGGNGVFTELYDLCNGR